MVVGEAIIGSMGSRYNRETYWLHLLNTMLFPHGAAKRYRKTNEMGYLIPLRNRKI
jgi:hypothetical protein